MVAEGEEEFAIRDKERGGYRPAGRRVEVAVWRKLGGSRGEHKSERPEMHSGSCRRLVVDVGQLAREHIATTASYLDAEFESNESYPDYHTRKPTIQVIRSGLSFEEDFPKADEPKFNRQQDAARLNAFGSEVDFGKLSDLRSLDQELSAEGGRSLPSG